MKSHINLILISIGILLGVVDYDPTPIDSKPDVDSVVVPDYPEPEVIEDIEIDSGESIGENLPTGDNVDIDVIVREPKPQLILYSPNFVCVACIQMKADIKQNRNSYPDDITHYSKAERYTVGDQRRIEYFPAFAYRSHPDDPWETFDSSECPTDQSIWGWIKSKVSPDLISKSEKISVSGEVEKSVSGNLNFDPSRVGAYSRNEIIQFARNRNERAYTEGMTQEWHLVNDHGLRPDQFSGVTGDDLALIHGLMHSAAASPRVSIPCPVPATYYQRVAVPKKKFKRGKRR